MKTAFVMSGGGSLGAVQVGMRQALDERGIHPHHWLVRGGTLLPHPERFLSLHRHGVKGPSHHQGAAPADAVA